MPVPIRVDQYGNFSCVPVVQVVGRKLVIPLQGSTIRIKGYHAVGVEIVSLARLPIPIGGGVANPPIKQVQLRIVRAGKPCRTAAYLPDRKSTRLNSSHLGI